MKPDRDPRDSLGFRARYWSHRTGALLLRAGERVVTGRRPTHPTRPLALRPPTPGGSGVEDLRVQYPATVVHYPPPDSLPGWLPREAALPTTWCYALREPSVAPQSGAVWLADGTPAPELFGGVSRYSGSQDVRGLTRRRPRTRLDGTWAVLPSHTYYHFLAEDLPSLLAALAFGREDLHAQVGVIAAAEHPRYVAEALGTLGGTVTHVRHPKVRVERLAACGFTTSMVHPASIGLLRAHFGVTDGPGDRWLYASRRGFRRSPEWEVELIASLTAQFPHLEVIDGHRMSLTDQVSAFSQAAAVIGPHGAGLTNLVFSPATTRVVEIMTPGNANDHFWRIAALRGQPYTMVWADPGDSALGVAERVARAFLSGPVHDPGAGPTPGLA